MIPMIAALGYTEERAVPGRSFRPGALRGPSRFLSCIFSPKAYNGNANGMEPAPGLRSPAALVRRQGDSSKGDRIMHPTFVVFFALCFMCFALRTLFNYLKFRGSPLAGKKAVVNAVYVVMAVLWFSWFQMCFFDPVKIAIPGWLRYAGLALFVSGVFLFVFSHVRLGGFMERGELVTGGIYSRIRNPMYLGFILWVVGFPVFTRSLATLISSAVWIAHFLCWKILEERSLEKKFPQYGQYKKQTWF
jgi:protein-S-isoprenylcysteine O-methyltransferase Ste14